MVVMHTYVVQSSEVATPKHAKAKPNCICKEFVIVSNNQYDLHLRRPPGGRMSI